jgi:hypothetical protein
VEAGMETWLRHSIHLKSKDITPSTSFAPFSNSDMGLISYSTSHERDVERRSSQDNNTQEHRTGLLYMTPDKRNSRIDVALAGVVEDKPPRKKKPKASLLDIRVRPINSRSPLDPSIKDGLLLLLLLQHFRCFHGI